MQVAIMGHGITGVVGAGAMTGIDSIANTGALTITAGAASTWSTSAGALTVDSAAGLNLGTTNATSVDIGRSGFATTIDGSLVIPNYIDLTSTTNPAAAAGRIFYDATLQAPSFYADASGLEMNFGRTVWARIKNDTGSTLPAGAVVYINGSDAGTPTVALAEANSSSTTQASGIMTAAVAPGGFGYATRATSCICRRPFPAALLPLSRSRPIT